VEKANIKLQKCKAKCKILINHLMGKHDDKSIRHSDVADIGMAN